MTNDIMIYSAQTHLHVCTVCSVLTLGSFRPNEMKIKRSHFIYFEEIEFG